jgi:hypothetical protein
MADCNCNERVPDYWLAELETICEALGFVAAQASEHRGTRHSPGVASTLEVLHAYLRLMLRKEVRYG